MVEAMEINLLHSHAHLPEQAPAGAANYIAKPRKTGIRQHRRRLDAVFKVIGARWVEHHGAKRGGSISVARKQDAIRPLL